jgi:hypothetical protein
MPNPAQSAIRNAGDFSALYRFELILSFPSGVTGVGSADEYNLRCETLELPKRTVTPVEHRLHGHKHKSAGVSEVNGILVFTFVETVDGKVMNLIKQWRDLIWAPDTGVQATFANYSTNDTEIHLLNNQDEAWWRYKMLGLWLEDNEAGGTPDGQTGDPLKPTLTFSFDDFEDGPV